MTTKIEDRPRSGDKPGRAKLSDKIKHGLDESLILITGAQILIGFDYQGVFNPGFDRLPEFSRYLKLGSLGLLLITLCLVLSPAPYHKLVEHNHNTRRFHRFIRKVITLALLPFALGLGIDIYLAVEKVLGTVQAIVAGGLTALVALFAWYGQGLVFKPLEKEAAMQEDEKEENDGKLADKIEQVLTETRVVLPGAQALLGFQFAGILMDGFEKLPETLKYVHLASLGLIALSVIFLMCPAAFHRIVEQGEDTERMLKFSSVMVLAALVPIALGIAGDLLVVVQKVSGSTILSLVCAATALTLFYGTWFGYTLYRRARIKQPSPEK
ncbi:MAG: hypothetical protein J0I20_09355 [Chloroflexi bacterium]|nr:hypothetical protein [Chloroflexota bacterium]OJV94681.1 MAG: hypothetical protein BGO39_23460 [Chloroflexi bacterium 54-19]